MVDFYKQVPKELGANLRYRLALRKRAAADDMFRRAMMTACREDPLYFFNAWCWLYEPRPRIVGGKKLPNVIPFITWPNQDPAILELDKYLGHEDIGAEKSRGEGFSWISVLMAVREFLFFDMSAIGLVSRTEMAVDNQDDPDSLFWKIDWELTKLPKWMAGVKDKDYKRSIAEHTLKNLRNGSTITGYSATGDVGSGGRKKWFLMDELAKFPRGPDYEAMASTQHVTNSRCVVSTPKGRQGAYAELMHEPSSMIKLVLDWKDNPTRNRGLYQFKGNVPTAVDPVNNPLSVDYNPPSKATLDLFSRLRRKGFKLEGRVRSPWYDHECDRPGATPHNIAQELDRDYGGSAFNVFLHDFFKALDATIRPPLERGAIRFHPETLEPEFESGDDGQFLLWAPLDNKKKPPAHPYVVAADICTGLAGAYTSNSVVQVIDQLSMEQVAEFASNSIPPADFADLCIAICKFFYDACLSWEINGPGRGFTKRVLDKKYGNLYRRTQHWKGTKRGKVTKDIGWHTDPDSKRTMFSEFDRSVRHGELILHSRPLKAECEQYVIKGDKIVHSLSVDTEDETAKGQQHGDRVIAMAVALMAVRDRPMHSKGLDDYLSQNPEPHTMAYRDKEFRDGQKKNDEWDARENYDMAHGDALGAGKLWN